MSNTSRKKLNYLHIDKYSLEVSATEAKRQMPITTKSANHCVSIARYERYKPISLFKKKNSTAVTKDKPDSVTGIFRINSASQ